MTGKELFEDILPLAPLQEGMLFHATYDRDALDVYTVRLAIDIEGPFDPDVLRDAVRALLVRRSNLRAGFLSENLSRPVQVVPREFETPVVVHDLSGPDEEERAARLAELVAAEESVRFDLADPPLLRFTVVRLGEHTWRLMFCCHHILLDGWSMPLVLGELFELYRRGGDATGMPPAPSFKLYLAWLREQDTQAGLDAWRAALDGLDGATLVAPEADDTVASLPGRVTAELSAARSAELAALARRLGLTVNTVVQVAWGLLLSRLTGEDDVVFGATVSGRPAGIEGVENIVGLFINTVPVRLRLAGDESLRELLLRVQDEQSALLDHHHIGLTGIQRAAGHHRLFDTLVAFESYPVDADSLRDQPGDLTITGVSGADATHYPLTLIVVPGERVQLRLGFREGLFTPDTAGGLLACLEQLLEAIAADDTRPAAEASAALTPPEGLPIARPVPGAGGGASVSDLTAAPAGGRAPRTPHEEVLCGLFAEALGVASVSIDDNFFDLGGHSLLATRLVSRIRSVFEIELPVRALFDAQTVVALAERVVGSSVGGRPPVCAVVRPERVPLSFAQRRLWFLNRMEGSGGTYNIPLAVRLSGALDVDALRAALRDVVGRHESLRTVFPDVDGEPWQEVVPAGDAVVSVAVVETTEEELPGALASVASVGFDLAVELPVRATVFRVSECEHVLCVVVHHIAGDGWSQAPLARDLGEAYRARVSGSVPDWRPLPVQYADYALWQRDVLGDEGDPEAPISVQLEFWREALRGLPEELALPVDRPRPAVAGYRGGVVSVELGARLHRELTGLARSTRSSLFMVLQAGVAGLLSRVGAGTDIPLGTAIAGRTDAALDDLVGFFVNTLVLRTDVSGDPGLREVVERVRATDLAAYAHQDLPFEQLVHAVQPGRSLARHPLFQVMIVLQNNARASLELPGVSARPIDGELGAAKFDLGFNFVERKDEEGAPAGVEVTVEYSLDLFDEETVARLARRLVRLLSLGVADPSMPLSRLDILEPREWRGLLAGSTDGVSDGVSDDTVPDLFAARVANDPDRLAVVAGDTRLSYAELDERSTRLAALLAARGVRRGDVVAVAVPRSAALAVAHLAVLRIGAACLPIETDQPADRIAHTPADAAPAAIVTTPGVRPAFPGTGVEVVVLDEETGAAEGATASPADVDALPGPLPDSPAHVIHVPDPEGRPRVVVVPHRGVVNRLLWMRDAHRLGPDDRVLHKAPADLDVSVWELLAPLVAGATLVVAEPGSHRDPVHLARLIRRAEVTTVHFAPSMLEVFLSEPEAARCTGLRRVLCSGEALSAGLRDRFRALWTEAELHVLHGPTEASFDALAWDGTNGTPGAYPPAGRPIRNTRAHVLDAHLVPLPVGSAGELYIGGVQLAHGYLGRPDLTAERFVADPYGPPGSRLHRTGDLARITRDGTVELLGRTDDRITVAGRQVEPGEIERVLTRHPAVDAAVVAARPGPSGRPVPVAYHTPVDPNAPADARTLREHAAAVLPDHMVPAHYTVVEEFPRTPDGGIDRAALPEPRYSAARGPRNDIERTLCGLFSELLGKPVTTIDDSFFDLGGHSLLATRLVSRVRSTFGIELPFRDIFDAQTVVALAERVVGSSVGGRPPVCAVVRPERVPLSFAQRRLWFLNRMEGSGGTYNIPLAVRLSGALDVDALRAALRDVVGRHESLRTVFPDVDGEPWQEVVPAGDAVVSVAVVETTEEELPGALASVASVGFDLAVELPVRATVFRVSECEHVLCVVVHHIAGDGWSQAPLARDLGEAYRARVSGSVPDWRPLPVQYADYALWQRDVLGDEGDPEAPISVQLEFWREALRGLPEELALPVDRPRPAVAGYRGGVVSVELGARLHRELTGLARSTRSSLFMVLQAGVAGLLSRVGAGTDIPLGTAIAGRTDAALDDLVGFFVNTLVLRTDVSGDPGLREVVERVRATDLAAYAHQDLPFEQLVHAVQPGRSLARHPLFQVMIVLQNNARASLELPGVSARPIDGELGAAKFDLGFNFVERADLDGAPAGIDMSIEYSRDLFDQETVAGLAERFVRLLTAGLADPSMPLSRLDILDPAERERLLTGWNDTARTPELPAATASGFEPETIAGLFAARVASCPDRLAVVAGDARLSYAELDERSTRLAALLAARGVRRGDVVAVAVPRSAALTVALLATIKAGAAYLPIETDYPADRIAHMLTDAAPAVVVTTRAVREELPTGAGHTAGHPIVLDEPDVVEETAALSADAGALPGPLPDSPAYVIYTSGSTGRPKGVVVPHRGIVNRLLWMQDAYPLGPEDRVLQKTPSGFDVSVWEFFWPLVAGAVQVAAEPGGHRDPRYLARLIREAGVTTAHFVPSMLEVFLAEPEAARCTGLRRVLCSGEALPAGLRDRFRALLKAELHNLYGPTEASVDVTAWDCATDSDAAVVPIGRPIWNTRAHVLDAALAPAPVGGSGELYLGGVQLAHGYLGRPDLTAERFVADPYGPPGSRLYRTGDLARVTRDGVIEFLGRTDDQVKIRGRRIEPGEIEHALARHPAVGTAIVTAHRESPGDVRLAAYVTPADPAVGVDPAVLRDHLAAVLPEHMVPAHYTVIDAVPVTPNGKVDRKALPAPRRLERAPGRAPRDGTEAALCEIFAELLGHETVTIDDNFFDLGGHSLLATRLIGRVRDRLGVEMSVVSIFEAPTPAALAVRLGREDTAGPLGRLLPLRPGGEGAPVFCVHPLGGLAWPYAGLAEHLPAGVALYGLQAAGLGDDGPLPDSIEEMAADYVARVRAVRPEGPYRLLGWSLGGRIAHAMAVLLESQGHEVELLALLDAYPRTAVEAEAAFSERDFLDGVLAAAGVDPSRLGGVVDFDTVLAAVRASGDDLAGLSSDQVRRLQKVMSNSFHIDARSLTGRCRAGAVMFAATVDPVGDPDHWRDHVDGGLEVHTLATSHNDLMRPGSLAEMGAVLAKKLADPARADHA
ncbi:non-ribosomal peptide synthetase [Streptomyces calidiresistens]|uniref:Amino acid adenylation domain-containing protein n=1 Tax=Streptomyces calidiresistens TaxID=1485586 RepID=A0A7W3SZ75_9ACTN|nr:non-ribosomal peptide synthetase [Streptomyces calidiresistens]MBB0228019.1 amino acid adenylation domain-containing protein [Streptomyces calidiresistens]